MERFSWLRSLSRPRGARLVSVVALTAMTSTGCILVHDSDDGPHNVTPSTHVDAVDVDITENELTTEPGAGVSILVEYNGSGRWTVDVTCDSELSGYTCRFDLFTRSPGIRVLGERNLESGDYIEEYGDQLHAAFDTGVDFDGLSFDTPLGEAVEIEAYLDGDNAHPHIFWIGNGVLHKEGAPTNPTLFIPPVEG